MHHQFLKQNFSQTRMVLIIYFIDILFAIASIVYVLGDSKIGMFIYAILFIAVVLIVFKTDIIFEKSSRKKKKKL